MPAAPKPLDEHVRIEKLEAYEILDSMPEQVFDDITYLASQICGTPTALISLIDKDRQWFKSRLGLDATETPREVAFCAYAILEPYEILEVENAADDPRFADNPLVHDGTVRFYAGAPLQAGPGSALGTLCVIDQEPHGQLSPEQQQSLAALARQVMGQLDLRKAVRDLEQYQTRLERYQEKLESTNQKLAAQRHTDGLTGIANRVAFDRRLDEEVHRARRYRNELSVLMLDVDHFKDFNDEFGHGAGDEALKEVARLLEAGARATDFVARYGGEEFVAILPETALEGAMVLAERIRRAIAAGGWEDKDVTVSIGAAELRPADDTPHALLARADAALYRAKEAGRNRVSEPPAAASGLHLTR